MIGRGPPALPEGAPPVQFIKIIHEGSRVLWGRVPLAIKASAGVCSVVSLELPRRQESAVRFLEVADRAHKVTRI